MADDIAEVNLPGIAEDLRQDIEERVAQFELQHQADVLRDGPGWVPRIRGIDYAIAFGVNLLFVLWLIIAFTGD
ncbi:hypothetical protein [Egicoccus sp. AB-alg2]|uniref:hypothetical protein n=1 Tax=Egicoccus sp. AB-alg2 TaxID=3242693 RepID=UPI00359DF5B2